jgi:hypothetical protein
MTLVTFIIPVRHPDNARDWSRLKANLAQTVASISNQTSDDWRGIIVANEGADLPDLPERFCVERVTFPPNDMHERGKASIEAFRDAFRADKVRAPSFLVTYLLSWRALKRPRQLVRNLGKVRLVGKTVKREFFGSSCWRRDA